MRHTNKRNMRGYAPHGIENHTRVVLVRSWLKESGLKGAYLAKKIGMKHQSHLSAIIGKNYSRPMPKPIYVKIRKFFNLK